MHPVLHTLLVNDYHPLVKDNEKVTILRTEKNDRFSCTIFAEDFQLYGSSNNGHKKARYWLEQNT